jgi:methyltransferase
LSCLVESSSGAALTAIYPNYIVVAVEILSFPLIFGAWVTALVFSVLNAALLYARISEEERALKELAG